MGIFEYLGVLISVIMGLGITHLAVGASKLVQNRDHCKPYLVHSLWTINVLLYILMIWWGMYWWSGYENWSVFQYLYITTYSIVLFFMSAMLYPYDMDKSIDVEAYFFKQRRWFFSALLVGWLMDVPETLMKSQDALRDIPRGYLVLVATMISITITGIVTSNRRVHFWLPIVWLLLIIGFISLTRLRVIAS